MHASAYALMSEFANKYVSNPCLIADIGSYDVNGTFRPLFKHCEYTGLDIEAGPNVDRVVKPYDWGPFEYDVVISGNTLEHVEDLKAWADQAKRICKGGGLLCIIAPHTFPEHRHPIDCWRILPDGMRWLFSDCKILECKKTEVDTMMVARKV